MRTTTEARRWATALIITAPILLRTQASMQCLRGPSVLGEIHRKPSDERRKNSLVFALGLGIYSTREVKSQHSGRRLFSHRPGRQEILRVGLCKDPVEYGAPCSARQKNTGAAGMYPPECPQPEAPIQ